MKREIRLKIIEFIHWLLGGKTVCWADCVTWASFAPANEFPKLNGSKECRAESIEVEYCMCGAFKDGKHMSEFSKEERVAMKQEEDENYERLKNDTPF